MNFLDGVVIRNEGRPSLALGDGIRVPLGASVGEGARVTLGVRPEDVTVGEGELQATVTVVEPTGHETLLTLSLGEVRLVARASPDADVRIDETVPVSLRPNRQHLFDAAGERIEPVAAG